MQHRVQGKLVTPIGEPVVDVSQPDSALAFGGPQHRPVGQPEAREHFFDVLLQDWPSPVEHRQHCPSARLGAATRLAPSDVAHAVATELHRFGVSGEVMEIEHRRFTTAQAVGIDDLEQGRVAVQGQPALPLRGACEVDVKIGVVEQRLDLDPGQRA